MTQLLNLSIMHLCLQELERFVMQAITSSSFMQTYMAAVLKMVKSIQQATSRDEMFDIGGALSTSMS